jgi:hypothetical protein
MGTGNYIIHIHTRISPMKNTIKAFLVLAVAAMAGCASHHQAPPAASHQISSAQASQNAQNNALYGGPLTSKAPSLAAYSLSGYGKPPKQ